MLINADTEKLVTNFTMNVTNSETVNTKHTEYFRKLSAEWWENAGLQMLKKTNEKVVLYVNQQLKKVGSIENTSLRGLKVLDVGCGGGFLSEELSRYGCELTGIDPNGDLIEVAKIHASSDPTLPKITYVVDAIEEYCQKYAGRYDVVISSFVLEHVDNPEYFIECCSKCLKPKGSLFISTAAKTYLAWFLLVVVPEYLLKTLPKGLHEFEKFIDASDTEKMIRSSGLEVNHTQGLLYEFLTAEVYWFPIHSNLYITHGVK